MQNDLSVTFGTPPTRNAICVVDGYGLCLRVERNRLHVRDGVGKHRRERVYSRATNGIKRLVILGHSGSVTLEAIRWMADVGIPFYQVDSEGRLIASNAMPGVDDPRLRRAQALAAGTPMGTEIVRDVLRHKLQGQLRNLASCLHNEDSVDALQACIDALERSSSLEQLRIAESKGAVAYWSAWETTRMPFAQRDAKNLPEHWFGLGSRRSPITKASARMAATPLNSMLNYLYALLQAEVRQACLVVGLDPGLGFLHADLKARDSLTLDLMEATRPLVDAFVLELLTKRTFRARDFFETRTGVVRILPPLTHELAQVIPSLSADVAPVMERAAQMIADFGGLGTLPTRLTEGNRRASRTGTTIKEIKADRTRGMARACRQCGARLAKERVGLCTDCSKENIREGALRFSSAGVESLRRRRDAGNDPAHGGGAAAKRGRSVARALGHAAEWEARNERPSNAHFTQEILPGLKAIPLSKLVAATGLSLRYCSLIRSGTRVPHPRHWDHFRALAETANMIEGVQPSS